MYNIHVFMTKRKFILTMTGFVFRRFFFLVRWPTDVLRLVCWPTMYCRMIVSWFWFWLFGASIALVTALTSQDFIDLWHPGHFLLLFKLCVLTSWSSFLVLLFLLVWTADAIRRLAFSWFLQHFLDGRKFSRLCLLLSSCKLLIWPNKKNIWALEVINLYT